MKNLRRFCSALPLPRCQLPPARRRPGTRSSSPGAAPRRSFRALHAQPSCPAGSENQRIQRCTKCRRGYRETRPSTFPPPPRTGSLTLTHTRARVETQLHACLPHHSSPTPAATARWLGGPMARPTVARGWWRCGSCRARAGEFSLHCPPPAPPHLGYMKAAAMPRDRGPVSVVTKDVGRASGGSG